MRLRAAGGTANAPAGMPAGDSRPPGMPPAAGQRPPFSRGKLSMPTSVEGVATVICALSHKAARRHAARPPHLRRDKPAGRLTDAPAANRAMLEEWRIHWLAGQGPAAQRAPKCAAANYGSGRRRPGFSGHRWVSTQPGGGDGAIKLPVSCSRCMLTRYYFCSINDTGSGHRRRSYAAKQLPITKLTHSAPYDAI